MTRREHQLHTGLVAALTVWLDTARALVLGHPVPDHSLTADAGDPTPAPDLDAAAASFDVWARALERHVFPVLDEAFGEAFAANQRAADISVVHWQELAMATVHDRLKIWPEGAFEELRPELLEAMANNEDIDQVQDRIGRILGIDAPARRIRAEISAIDRRLKDPTTPRSELPLLRGRRRELWQQHDERNLEWQWLARRIARTEIQSAMEAGALAAAQASEEATGEKMYKRWLSTPDDRVRASHAVADGQMVRLTEPFCVGGFPVQHPADPFAPAHESINCRCSLTILSWDEMQAELQGMWGGRGVGPMNARLGPDDEAEVEAAIAKLERERKGEVVDDEPEQIPADVVNPDPEEPATTAPEPTTEEPADQKPDRAPEPEPELKPEPALEEPKPTPETEPAAEPVTEPAPEQLPDEKPIPSEPENDQETQPETAPTPVEETDADDRVPVGDTPQDVDDARPDVPADRDTPADDESAPVADEPDTDDPDPTDFKEEPEVESPTDEIDDIEVPDLEPPVRVRPELPDEIPSIGDLVDEGDPISAREAFTLLDGMYGQLEHRVVDVLVESPTSANTSSTITVRGNVLRPGDAPGQSVGMTFVIYSRDLAQALVAEIDYIELAESARRQGFTTAFYAMLIAYYQQSGVDRVTLEATLSDGGYFWALTGFTWDASEPDDLADSIADVRRRIAVVRATASESDRAVLDALDQRMRDHLPFDPRFPTPREIATLSGDDPQLGRNIMRGSSWRGVNYLSKGEQ